MLVQIINISLTLQKIVRVKLPSFHATFENSKRNSNTDGELMRGGSGGRINIYSEDLSGDLCKSGPGHFASEKSFPSNFSQ